jgi:hypothetical protein
MRDLLIATLLLLVFQSIGIYLRRLFERSTRKLLNDKFIIPIEIDGKNNEIENKISTIEETSTIDTNIKTKNYKKDIITEIIEGRNLLIKVTESHTRYGFIFSAGLLLVWFNYYLGNFPFSIIISLLVFILTILNYFVYYIKRNKIIEKHNKVIAEYNLLNNRELI